MCKMMMANGEAAPLSCVPQGPGSSALTAETARMNHLETLVLELTRRVEMLEAKVAELRGDHYMTLNMIR